MRIRAPFMAAIAAAALACAVGPVNAVTLSDLINHTNGSDGTVTAGDKVFSGFTYSGTAQGGATPVPASSIDVEPLLDDGFGNYGVQFSALWAVSTPGTSIDSRVTFAVDVTDPKMLIDDVALNANFLVTVDQGGTRGGSGTFGEIQEDLGGAGPSLSVNDATSYNHEFITPTAHLVVTKDLALSLDAQAVDTRVTLSSFWNSFSQTSTVPEPGSVAMLFGLAISGSMFGFRLRRLKRA